MLCDLLILFSWTITKDEQNFDRTRDLCPHLFPVFCLCIACQTTHQRRRYWTTPLFQLHFSSVFVKSYQYTVVLMVDFTFSAEFCTYEFVSGLVTDKQKK